MRRRRSLPPQPEIREAEVEAIARFVERHGVLRCPTAHAAPSQHSEPQAEVHLPFMRRDYRTGLWRREPA